MKLTFDRQAGFTLIELMVTIAILAVIASLAAPAVGTFVSRSVMRGISADFTLAMQRARSEAINRNECVVICMSDDGVTCTNTGQNWGIGWIVFRNPSCAAPTSSSPSDSSNIILVREGVNERYQLSSSTTTRYVTFGARGNTSSSSNGRFNLTDTSAPASEGGIDRTFCLDKAGRVRTLDYASSCS